MIQRNLQLISVKRNEITTVCSVRNHFLTDGLKTMQAYMKSNCIAAGSTIIPWMMIFQPFCNAWDVAEFPKKKKSLKYHDSAKNRNPLFKKSCAAASFSFAYLSRAKQIKNYKASCRLKTGKNWELLISFLFPETSLLRKYPENSPGSTAKHRHIVKSFQEAI